MKVRITRKFETATDICAFELADPEGTPLPAFSAGAHIDVHLGNGLVRQYSLCNNPNDRHRYMLGVLRDPVSRGGSVAMHALREGDEVEISEPRNHFPLAAEARHSILLAGGIGVTPILCMAERLAHIGASFEFHYCTRSPERTAFRDRLAEPDLQGKAHLYHDSEPPEKRIDLAAVLGKPDAGTHLYVCGPGGFIDAVLNAAKAAGWPEQNVHREYFSAAPAATAEDGSFEVKIASTGQIVVIPPDQTVTEALAAAGVEVLTSCEQGVCGTCLTRVLEGVPDHRDLYLTDAEHDANDQFLPCCSRSKTPMLVLDL
ncbi:PDR/VanB family oxidoreductase [Pigmentiphaga soli]|uniref:PDR/VanB family oxidoreductase n=1 Tax=Pigmentiphaga soli TaxID=1007095 RepID=A0ABP8GTN9_9BURK